MYEPNTEVDLERYAKILSRTPDLLRRLLGDLPDALLEANYGAGTWSAREVMSRMIYEEQYEWIPSARRLMDGEDVIPPEFVDHNGRRALFRHETPDKLLERFASLREANLAKLHSMSIGPGDLARRGRHPDLGFVTLGQLLATWMVHDLCHIANICKAMALACSQEAGPWQAYLSILTAPIEKRGYS
jgi:hypothetical protein